MRDLHQRVVHDHGEVVRGPAVGADQDRIADDIGIERDVAADEIRERHVDVLRNPEADDGALAGVDAAAAVLGRQVAAGARVARRPARRQHRAAIGFELLRRAEAMVRVAGREQLVGVRRYR